MKFRPKFNHGFTNRGCFHCAFIKALYNFKEKRAHKAQDMQFFLQNIQNEIFKILKMFKYNMKFTWNSEQPVELTQKISNRDKSTALMIFVFCLYCWSLLWCNYWRSLMLWNSTSWIPLKLTVPIQLALYT